MHSFNNILYVSQGTTDETEVLNRRSALRETTRYCAKYWSHALGSPRR